MNHKNSIERFIESTIRLKTPVIRINLHKLLIKIKKLWKKEKDFSHRNRNRF